MAAEGSFLFIYNGLSIIFYVGLFILINFNTGKKKNLRYKLISTGS